MSSITSLSLPHRCEAWKPENFTEPDSSSPYHEFFIEVFAQFEAMEEDGQRVTSPTKYKKFIMPRDLLMKGSTSWSSISNMLSQMDVPYNFQPFMIQKISTFARELACEADSMCRKTIPMVVALTVALGTQQQGLSPSVRASKSSVEALEKVKIEGFPTQCVVCLEDILMGSEAARMPCSHVYHGDCIVNWLKKSNLCPLCRFQMPAE
ncbi:uncharacterized protein LOC132175124 [Corylus avellana]|uniref:uncharacterized protein LOC132175124 n=1 Tax=Corylus avellana TaxID=13451 RepID=UPI001E22ED31|nr:uncharacterized protein LOC132175124 [Corylus avellana]